MSLRFWSRCRHGRRSESASWGGANIAKLWSDQEDPDVTLSSKTFLAAGIVVDAGFNDKLSLQLEPMYLEKGGKVELRDFFGDDFVFSRRLSYSELPVLLKVSKPTGTVRPYLIAGPSVGYRTGVKASDETTGEEESPDDADEMFEKWDFGVGAGGGLSFSVGRATVFAEGRYTWGLATLNKEQDVEDAKLKNRGVQVLAGLTFPLGAVGARPRRCSAATTRPPCANGMTNILFPGKSHPFRNGGPGCPMPFGASGAGGPEP